MTGRIIVAALIVALLAVGVAQAVRRWSRGPPVRPDRHPVPRTDPALRGHRPSGS